MVVLFDPTTLSVLDQIFDLHTIFPPTVTPAPPAAPVHMRFLLVGQGRLVMSYDGAASYARVVRLALGTELGRRVTDGGEVK